MNEFYAAILGIITGGIVTYFVSYFLLKKQRSLEAAAKFREAFSEEIAKCKYTKEAEIKSILIKAMIKHEKAVILYEPFINKSKIDNFRRTWDKYCELNSYSNINDFVPETGINKEGYIRELSEKEQRDNSLSFLVQLIKYAPVK